MKVFSFIIFAAALALSAAGVNDDLVALTGCASALVFSALVIRDVIRAWRTCDE